MKDESAFTRQQQRKRDTWIPVSLVLLFIIAAAFIVFGTQRVSLDNAKLARESQAQSQLAFDKATVASTLVFAVCKRFHRDESQRAVAAQRIAAIEEKYPRPNAQDPEDVVYHEARIKAIGLTAKETNDIANFDCKKAMQKAMTEAPGASASPAEQQR